jgi:hypothetical protein
MKVMVRMSMILAVLLVVASAAFAAPPIPCTGDEEFCYLLTTFFENGSSDQALVKICLNNDGTGKLFLPDLGNVDLDLFGGGPFWTNFEGSPAFGGHPNWSTWITRPNPNLSLYLQPSEGGPTGALLTGEGYVVQYRVIIQGTKLACPF